MNAIQNSDSTEPATVYVVGAGLVGEIGRGRHLLDVEAVADAVETAVGAASDLMGERQVGEILLRSSYPVEQELENRTEDLNAAPDVDFFELSWMLFLDDDGVKRPSDDPVAEIMTDEGVIDSPDDLDLNDYEDRQAKVDTEFLDEDRIDEAKTRAAAVTDNVVFSNDKDYPLPEGESADAVVVLHDGNVAGTNPNSDVSAVIERANGYNDYVQQTAECEGPVLPVNVDNEILDWEFYLLQEGAINASTLTDGQEMKLRTHHSEEELEAVGLEVNTESESEAESATEIPEDAKAAEVKPADD